MYGVVYGGAWVGVLWCMVVYGGSRWCTVVCGGVWWYMAIVAAC